jgi:hypothetical protein
MLRCQDQVFRSLPLIQNVLDSILDPDTGYHDREVSSVTSEKFWDSTLNIHDRFVPYRFQFIIQNVSTIRR